MPEHEGDGVTLPNVEVGGAEPPLNGDWLGLLFVFEDEKAPKVDEEGACACLPKLPGGADAAVANGDCD